jgi:Domain of unknown function (DUF3786)/Putative Fe-S cluster
MPHPKHAMEVFQLLDKSNCRDCGEKTCLAFAGKVFTGQKRIHECPRLDDAAAARFADGDNTHQSIEENREDQLEEFKDQIRSIDLAVAAKRIGATHTNGKLTLKILGKDFSVSSEGVLSADIHVNPWVAAPFLDYVLNGRGVAPTGDWVTFRELKEGAGRYPLFQKRCEEPLKVVADTYTGLFDDMVHIFGGKQVEQQFRSDISVVLHPLPRVPLMVCYWLPEEGLASSLNLFFDRTAEANLSNGSLFSLAAGLALMLSKLALRHGYNERIS